MSEKKETNNGNEIDIEDLEENGEDIQFIDMEQTNGPIFHDAGDDNGEEEGEPKSLIQEILSWVIPMAIAVAAALLLKNFVIINANVPTGSMLNTIQEGDDLFGLRLAYKFSEPKRGDIVIFYYPDDPTQKYIKRIIGEPGDKVVIEDSKIYINDSEEPLEEDYLPEEWTVNNGPFEFRVPEDSYLMLGDNRNNSWDARYWENTYVSRDAIIGKAWFIYYPFSHMKTLN